tara:strand:+ start:279 stop:509 length:231 start_codon:yes stop_codon:yes gene_type:complete
LFLKSIKGKNDFSVDVRGLFSLFSNKKEISGIITPKLSISKIEPIIININMKNIVDFLKSDKMLISDLNITKLKVV